MRVLVAAAVLAAACGEQSMSDPTVFIANASDFDHYTSWAAYENADSIAQAASHPSGASTEYLSRRPTHGATTFPVGSIIVKVMPSVSRVFGMVKRGGDFNATGATGWEWLELTYPADDPATIIWRGLGPPAGESYGGPGNSDCNNCHTGAWQNDFVQSAELQLASF